MWDGVLDATSYGYVCPLLEMPKPNGEMLVPHRYWLMNEACQNLNIWTPALDDAHRPVLVWLHGGGYFAGSSIEQIAYEGENMARLGDCVVVSINHRLNILGYLDLSDFGVEYANSGNAGGDDIIAALRWVRDNIAAFGGDPGNVTVFGQSGGGAKVTTLLQTPAADGLFHKGIVMSGVLGRLADCTGSGRDCAEALMAELGAADETGDIPGTAVHVAVADAAASDWVYAGYLVISDEIKPDAPEAIAQLKALGVRKTVMLTGDAPAAAGRVAAALGLDETHAGLLPDGKVAKGEELLAHPAETGVLAFVGDGINDAPVLSRADVGIAMGGLGSDAAIEAADVVLMDDQPSKIAAAIRLSRRTLRIVRQNIVFALGVKLLFLALGAFGLANMWEAVFADVGVSVIAILNATRALRG